MKRKIHTQIMTALFMLFFTSAIYAQYPQYESVANGDWSTTSIWTYKANASAAWATPSAAPSTGSFVTIKSGHKVALTGSTNTAGINIEEGAVLYAKAVAATTGITLSIINSATDIPAENFIVNNGTILSGNITASSVTSVGHIRLQMQIRVKKFTLTGTGATYLGRIYARGRGDDKQLEVVIDQDVILNESNSSPAFSAMDAQTNQRTEDDDVTFTINAGKKVELVVTGATSPFHHASSGNTLGGKYTYNINGTLDFSKSTAISYVTPNTTSGALTTINVAGKFILGQKFVSQGHNTNNLDPAVSTLGIEDQRIKINILDGGEIDLNSNTTLTLGKVFFNASGTGKVIKTVPQDTETIFPVGSGNTYSPVWVKNVGTAANTYTVNVKSDIDYAEINQDKSVKKQWTVLSATEDGATLKFGWLATDAGASFNQSNLAVFKREISANTWEEKTAATSVDGDLNIAEVCNCNTPGIFFVSNSGTLPLDLLSFEEDKNVTSGVGLKWITANERNVMRFDVERSLDGINFTKIGEVFTQEGNGTKVYYFNDKNVAADNYYYRLKSVDQDLKFSFSKTILVKSSQVSTVSTYPNPVVNTLYINIPKDQKIERIKVFNIRGEAILNRAVSTGETEIAIDLSGKAPGHYLLETVYEGKNEYKKIIKQ